jgi:copper oxidase (laccase) domain-containing protein
MKTLAMLAVSVAIVAPVHAGWRTTVRGTGSTLQQAYDNAMRQVWPGYRVVHSATSQQGNQYVVTLIVERD